MSSPSEKSFETDPEIEALLSELPPALQQGFRDMINRLQPIMSPDDWKNIRNGLIHDIKFQLGQNRNLSEVSEVKEKLDTIQKDVDEVVEIEEKLNIIAEIEEKMNEINEGLEAIKRLQKKLDSLNK